MANPICRKQTAHSRGDARLWGEVGRPSSDIFCLLLFFLSFFSSLIFLGLFVLHWKLFFFSVLFFCVWFLFRLFFFFFSFRFGFPSVFMGFSFCTLLCFSFCNIRWTFFLVYDEHFFKYTVNMFRIHNEVFLVYGFEYTSNIFLIYDYHFCNIHWTF